MKNCKIWAELGQRCIGLANTVATLFMTETVKVRFPFLTPSVSRFLRFGELPDMMSASDVGEGVMEKQTGVREVA